MNIYDQAFIWIPLSLLIFVGCQWLVLFVENDYFKQFDQSLVTWKQSIPGALVGFFLAGIYGYLMREHWPFICFVPLALATSALIGIMRVDLKLLLIPDRFQVLGLFSGLLHILLLILSGEYWKDLAVQIGLGFAIVGLLWMMSFIYFKIRGEIGFGFGDVKLLGWLTFFVQKALVDVVMWSIAVGFLWIIGSIIHNGFRNRTWTLPKSRDAFAFGPCIIIGAFIEGVIRYV